MPTPVSPTPTDYRAPVPAAALRWGADGSVGAPTLSYGFATATSTWDFAGAYTQPGQPTLGFATFDEALQAATRSVLSAWASICGLRFVEVTDNASGHGDLRYAFTQFGMSATQLGAAFLPNASDNAGDVWLNAALRDSRFASLQPGTVGYFTLLHETGHALGLRHPETPGSEGGHSVFQSVMSVNAWPGIALSYNGNIDRLPTTPMSWDIDAMRALYGGNLPRAAGDENYRFDAVGRYLQTIYDTGGHDVVHVDGDLGAEIDLRPGEWSRIGLAVQIENGRFVQPDTVQIYRESWIEDAVGTHAPDTIIGNALDNRLEGRGGDDHIEGGAGLDHAVYAALRGDYSWRLDAGVRLVSPVQALSGGPADTGTDTLIDVERLQFADLSVAFDVQAESAAGRAALLSAALAGPSILNDQTLVGRVIAYFDQGHTLQEGVRVLLGAGVVADLAGGHDHVSVVRCLYRNVTGAAEPTAVQLAPYQAMLDRGTLGLDAFIAQAATLTPLQDRIGLTALALMGLVYVEAG